MFGQTASVVECPPLFEKLVPEFYERIGQRLRPWMPPPPPIERQDSGVAGEGRSRSEDSAGA